MLRLIILGHSIACLPLIYLLIPVEVGLDVSVNPAVAVVVTTVTPSVLDWVISNKNWHVQVIILKCVVFAR